ncbi:MAG: hypothetical protein KDA41_08235 [Planctomycetales bacterium]|nr:hypothetical protein [Planctomycetales bacterium]
MLQKNNARWAMLIAANAMLWCVLGFYGTSGAAPKPAPQPFANATEQRASMIGELQEIRALLKEQNALLRSGKVQVVVVESP